MATLFLIILSAFLVSLMSFIGVLTLSLQEKKLDKILTGLVALSVGGMLGGAFLHLIPEAVEVSGGINVYVYVLIGFFLFLLIEKFMHWRHCHDGHCPVHTFAYINLFGDGLHNFIDGLIIAASFLADFNLGLASTAAIIMHEIPQEIGDFGVLIYGGFSRAKALFFNFLSAVLAVFGGIAGFYFLGTAENLVSFLLPFAAGGFIYIAGSDLLPEIKKEENMKKFSFNIGILFIGILFMYIIKILGVE